MNIKKGTRDICITGGAGFIGTNLLGRIINDTKGNIIVVDDMTTGRHNRHLDNSRVVFIQEDVRQCIKQLVESLSDNSIVYHLAARNISSSIEDPISNFEVNTQATFGLLEEIRQSKKNIRIIYSSSCSIYGNSRYLPTNEDDNPNILSPYAASKYSGETFCSAYYENYGLPISIVRFSNVYGPHQYYHEGSGVVTKTIKSIINNEPVIIHGDGEQTRDYTYVDDAIDALLRVACSEKSIGKVYNIGTGKETSVNEIVNHFDEITKRHIERKYIENRDIDNIRRRVLNVERIRKELKWAPVTSLRNGLNRTFMHFTNSAL